MAEANEIHHRTGENCLTITRHLMEGFIDMPAATNHALPSAPDLVREQGGKPCLPVPDGFMTELVTTDQEHLDQISQTQFEEQPKEHDLEYNVGRHLQKIERGSGPFIKGPSAPTTTKDDIAQIGLLRQCLGLSRSAMRTVHGFASP
jgi:hypothetical protein